MSDKISTRVITPEAILSYPRLFTPQAMDSDDDGKASEAKYSTALVFSPDAVKSPLFVAMKRAAVQAVVNKLGNDKAAAMLKNPKFNLPFRTDVEDRGYSEGSVFFNARSKQRPGIVASVAGVDGKARPITEEDQEVGGPYEMYAGVRVRASVTFFYYDTKGNKGVGVALGNIQRIGDGPRLDNRVAASDEFGAELQDEPASLDGLS